MKMLKLLFVALLGMVALKSYSQTNDFYDDAETVQFQIPEIEIVGEITNTEKIKLAELPLRSLIVKETLLEDGKDVFVGAYRYDGYSLYDILNKVVLAKKNEVEFPPIIDLYVEISNNTGDKVVVSWGEIFYPIHRHEIVVATQVARIVPSKTKDLWPLPFESKMVFGSDLYTHRNISNPNRIAIKSYSGNYEIVKGLSPMYSKSFRIENATKIIDEVGTLDKSLIRVTYPSVFYGRGRGIHGTTPFTGVFLKDVLKSYLHLNAEALKTGIVIIAGKDGYRAVYTISEIFNRNDQAEFLLLEQPDNQDGGAYLLFPASDFFSDRAIRSIQSIRFEDE